MIRPIQTGWGVLATVVLSATLWNACSTEVDLTAPYDSIPVVYGLLELESDTQWVKINRTWLEEGNQLEAAQIADSSEYPAGSVAARIVELIPSGTGEIVGNELATGRDGRSATRSSRTKARRACSSGRANGCTSPPR